jgi:hypothetical protein
MESPADRHRARSARILIALTRENREAVVARAMRKDMPSADTRIEQSTEDRQAQQASVDPMLASGDALEPAFDATDSTEMRRRMIAEAAYYIAQRRGFADGFELDDWLLAETEVDARLKGKPPA